jgi:hypothetical protein
MIWILGFSGYNPSISTSTGSFVGDPKESNIWNYNPEDLYELSVNFHTIMKPSLKDYMSGYN